MQRPSNGGERAQIRAKNGSLLDSPFVLDFGPLRKLRPALPTQGQPSRSSASAADTIDDDGRPGRCGVGAEKMPVRSRLEQERAIREIYGGNEKAELADAATGAEKPNQHGQQQEQQNKVFEHRSSERPISNAANRQKQELQRKLKLPNEFKKRRREQQQQQLAGLRPVQLGSPAAASRDEPEEQEGATRKRGRDSDVNVEDNSPASAVVSQEKRTPDRLPVQDRRGGFGVGKLPGAGVGKARVFDDARLQALRGSAKNRRL